MSTQPASCVNPASRTAVLASSDVSFRRRVREALTGLRWQVREAGGGAEALAELDASPTEALILDSWLPDLEMDDFVAEFRRQHPAVDLVMVNGSDDEDGRTRSPRRHEILYAIRRGQDSDGAIWNSAQTGKRWMEAASMPQILSRRQRKCRESPDAALFSAPTLAQPLL